MAVNDLGTVKPGTTLFIPFHTFDSNDPSASVTITGLAVGDIRVYKDGGITQRASTSGFTLLDTDGTDFDAVTGLHGISIDLSDNTTANFYEAGSQYWVVISSITVDAATVNFVLAVFRIGYQGAMLDTTIATLASQTSFTLEEGPADNDALNGCRAIIHDLASAVQIAQGVVSNYVGSTRTVTLAADPAIFTMAAGDNISFFPRALESTVAGRTLDVTATGAAGIDWANVENPTTALDLSGTDIQLVDTTTVNTDMRGTDSAALASVATEARLAELDGVNLPTDVANVQSDTDNIQTRLPTTLIGGRMDATIDATGMESGAVDNIWNRDATSNQTAGTFGEALGDPAATGESIRQLVGEFNASAAAGDPSITESVMQYVKQLVNILVGTAGVTTFPAEAAPANAVSLAEVIRAIHTDVTGLNGDVMRGTDGVDTAAMRGTDSAALASVATEVRLAELDAANLPTTTDDILTDTAVIGALGAGLTAINLPDQTMNITGNITGNLSGSVGSVTGSVGSVVGHTNQTGDNFARLGAPAGASVSADIAAIEAQTDDIGVAGAGLTDLGGMSTGMRAEVNAEVVDVINTDTSVEPAQGAPPATASLRTKLDWLYKVFRNRKRQTATIWELMNDAETVVDSKATVSDDGTTAIKQEIVSGP